MPDSAFPASVIIVGAIAFLIVAALFVWVAMKARGVNLTQPTDGKPEWMRNAPPKESAAATTANGEGIQVFDHDEGEAIASPFAEQIEDILQARLDADPELKKYKVDLGTGPDGRLEISVNGETYTDISAIPDAKLKKLFNEAVEAWKKS